MKVRMKVTVTGTNQGVRCVAGEVVELPDGAAAQMCDQGLAEPVAERPVERAETRAEPSEPEPTPDVVECDDCDYSGTERGLSIHRGQKH